jgi:MurE/MurF fusion protein
MLIGKYLSNIKDKYKRHFFSGLSFNSLNSKENDIFFAIKGNNVDGKKFVKDAIKKKVKVIISSSKFQGIKDSILYLNSSNVRKTLSEIAFKFYNKKPKNLIAVTGTNGKSSIAEFFFQILRLNKKRVASIGTLGVKTTKSILPITNTTLDPISLAQHLKKLKDKKVNNVILEASSHGLKQNRLDGLKFNIGIFTNLSHDHLDYHKNLSDYLNSKLYLFKKLLQKKSMVITDLEIPEFKKIKKISINKKIKIKTISNKKSDLSIISHEYIGEKQLLKIRYKRKTYNLKINLIGKIQIKNILMSMLAAEGSGLSFQKITKIIDKIKPVTGRLEKVGKIKNNSCAILDYAHTPQALRTCLKNLKDQFKNRKISIVFGCGGNRDKFKRSIMGEIANKYCDKIYLTDDNPRKENPKKIRNQIKTKIDKSKLHEIANRETAINESIKNLLSAEILVVAGKGHENIQDYGLSKKFFSDKKFILKYIKEKNNKLSDNLKINILNEGRTKNKFNLNSKIHKASINSKEIKRNDIFFAIRGKSKDGNSFIKEVFKKKASFAIVNKINKSESRFKQIKVKNTLDFLTNKSLKVRENSKAKIIAITGSCGKTSLKELLNNTLSKFSEVSCSPKSFNNKYGVPISLFNLNLNHDFGIFEVGMDKKGEINNLTNVIKPDIGLITNISYAHAKNFKNIKEIALAKSEIIQNINKDGFLVLNADDNFFDLHKKIAQKNNIQVRCFSILRKQVDIKLDSIKKEKSKFKITIIINNKKKYFFMSNNFNNNIKNLLAALTVISIFRDITRLDKNIFFNNIIPEGRGDISKIKISNKSIFLIDESYNSNPLSIKSAINNFDLMNIKGNTKHLVLGDMLELGKHSKKLHKEISRNINNSNIDKVHVFGKHIKETYQNIYDKKKGSVFKETSQIIDLIKNNINNNDYVMIKGSNSTGLNKLTKNLKNNKNAL